MKLTYHNCGDVMILEMRKEYKEKICLENHTYRICWMLYEELVDIIGKEALISEDFKAYLVLLEEQRKKQYKRHYEWGCAVGDRATFSNEPGDDVIEEKRRVEAAKTKVGRVMKYYSEEIFMLWKLFCRVEAYCRAQEAAYMCVLGMEEGESKRKHGIHPL